MRADGTRFERIRTNSTLLIAGLLVLLNFADAVLTLLWVDIGVAEEANPLWRDLIDASPVLFMAAKLALVMSCVVVLLRFREHALAKWGLTGTFGAYALLFGWHLTIASTVFASGV